MTYHDITTLNDPLYDDYLDLYQRSFPLNEQGLVGDFNRLLRRRMLGEVVNQHLVAALSNDGSLIGMAEYAINYELAAGVLWYLAVSERRRGLGTGSEFYIEIARRVQADLPHALGVVFEVERPDHCGSTSEAELAERRIRFYQRNGAFLLGGIEYIQSTGWQPGVPMHLMVHPFAHMTPQAAFQLCGAVFGASVTRAGDLTLTTTE